MISETVTIIRRNILFYILAVALVIAVFFLDHYHPSSSNYATGIIWLGLSRWTQEAILYGRKFNEADRESYSFSSYFAFFAKSSLIVILAIIPALAFMVYYMSYHGEMNGLMVLYFVVIVMVVTSLLLALIGTWLPAGLYGRETYLSDAIRRGTRSFPKTFGRMIAGWTIPSLVGFFVIAFMLGNGNSMDMIADGTINLPALLVSIFLTAMQAVSVTYVSVVLTRQYMKAEGLPENGQVEGVPAE